MILVAVFVVYKYFSTTQKSNTSISGWFIGNQIWSGDIYVTGDVEILGNLLSYFAEFNPQINFLPDKL